MPPQENKGTWRVWSIDETGKKTEVLGNGIMPKDPWKLLPNATSNSNSTENALKIPDKQQENRTTTIEPSINTTKAIEPGITTASPTNTTTTVPNTQATTTSKQIQIATSSSRAQISTSNSDKKGLSSSAQQSDFLFSPANIVLASTFLAVLVVGSLLAIMFVKRRKSYNESRRAASTRRHNPGLSIKVKPETDTQDVVGYPTITENLVSPSFAKMGFETIPMTPRPRGSSEVEKMSEPLRKSLKEYITGIRMPQPAFDFSPNAVGDSRMSSSSQGSYGSELRKSSQMPAASAFNIVRETWTSDVRDSWSDQNRELMEKYRKTRI